MTDVVVGQRCRRWASSLNVVVAECGRGRTSSVVGVVGGAIEPLVRVIDGGDVDPRSARPCPRKRALALILP